MILRQIYFAFKNEYLAVSQLDLISHLSTISVYLVNNKPIVYFIPQKLK